MKTHKHRWNPVELCRLYPATFFIAEQPMSEDDPASVSVRASMIASSPVKSPHLTRLPFKSVSQPLTCASIKMSVTLAIYKAPVSSLQGEITVGATCTHLLHHHQQWYLYIYIIYFLDSTQKVPTWTSMTHKCCLPSVRARVFLLWYSFWRWAFGLLSQKKKMTHKCPAYFQQVKALYIMSNFCLLEGVQLLK